MAKNTSNNLSNSIQQEMGWKVLYEDEEPDHINKWKIEPENKFGRFSAKFWGYLI